MMGSIGALASSVLFPVFLHSTGDIRTYFYLAAFSRRSRDSLLGAGLKKT
jgi:hypothetical protein